MTIPAKYNPAEIEDKWYEYWMKNGFFHSSPNPDKEPYTIVIPPPNVTGVLHMGHMLNNTIQDVIIRRARMMGFEACWVPGTDHASIATEAKVVAMLKEKGLNKSNISREDFLKYAWEWKAKYGGIILEQLKKLGASCDWDRTKFTMDPEMSESVIYVFTDLYKKGHIYRGYRMVNWDPEGKTAIADDEVIHREVASKLYYINYKIEGSDEHITIATTRPETILGDTAICVHPKDKRYKHLKGKKALVPLINRPIPIIEDEYVDREFGTGCLKITPAHDVNDFELGRKHNLETIDILNDDGTLNENAQLYIGEDRFVVKEKIAKDLEKAGHIQKIEDYVNNVGFSERTDAVVEPRLSLQWYVRMDKFTKGALDIVMDDTIKLFPPKFKNMYRHWMENVRDWCISRQLWWGQRIPAYYLAEEDMNNPDAQVFVGTTIQEALKNARQELGRPELTEKDLRQDEDVLDTWFSSGLWPITVFDGIRNPDNEDIKYYYPTNDLVTAPEILFFWVARMIMYGYGYMAERPFDNVYLTGIVRDAQGRKMSKSLGNSPDPIELIKEYGADGVRTGMLFSSPAGNDLLFDIKLCEQGRNFSNKIWNAFRLVKGWEVDENIPTPAGNEESIKWLRSRLNQVLEEANDQFAKFRISDVLRLFYTFTWNEFCAWFLEMIKPEYQKPIDRYTYDVTVSFFEDIMKLLHPFMPFITEEIWHDIREREVEDCILIAPWPEAKEIDTDIINEAAIAFELISQVRNIRNSKNIPNKQRLNLEIKGNIEAYRTFIPIILKLANLESFEKIEVKNNSGLGFVIRDDEFNIPVSEGVDLEKEKENLETELKYTRGFKHSVSKKLSNASFVQNAPEKVVDMERKKLADAEARIEAIEKALKSL